MICEHALKAVLQSSEELCREPGAASSVECRFGSRVKMGVCLLVEV